MRNLFSAAANKHLTPCTLELGGKSPAFVDDSGNLEVRLEGLAEFIIILLSPPVQSEEVMLGQV